MVLLLLWWLVGAGKIQVLVMVAVGLLLLLRQDGCSRDDCAPLQICLLCHDLGSSWQQALLGMHPAAVVAPAGWQPGPHHAARLGGLLLPLVRPAAAAVSTGCWCCTAVAALGSGGQVVVRHLHCGCCCATGVMERPARAAAAWR